MRKRLSDSFVERLKPGPTVIRVWDIEVKGFGLRVTPNGAKSYVFQFTRDKRKIQATIGSASCWTTDEARDLEELVGCWREDYKSKLRPHSQARYESLLNRILPELGRRLVRDLTLADVESFYRKIMKEGYEVTANRCVTLLRRLLNIAERKGWRAMGTNPVTHLERHSEESRDRVLSGKELESLGAALHALEGTRLDPDPIRFLALSGLRMNEALGLRWLDIDFNRNTMTFRVHKTSRKAGAKVLPINSHLLAILKARAEVRISHYVFPGYFKRVTELQEDGTRKVKHVPTDGPLNSIKRVWENVTEDASLGKVEKVGRRKVFVPDAVIHDLRRTFNTVCAELGYPPQVFDALLGHKVAGVAGVYTRLSAAGGILAEASQATSDWIAAALDGRKPRLGEKVNGPSADPHGEGSEASA
ncbi:site-specific integrase [Geothrix sp. 21YS21S-2]|uniref:site-specific integrase n=1 Tax=Geothrix sp. 21YS21S-2 TaxID=3068893 RepID=UPI0027B9B7B7|nr:site-specific integrase [Geothrix sp. 21YS21S-2]